MLPYHHRQAGTVVLGALGLALLLIATLVIHALLGSGHVPLPALLAGALVAVALGLFASLTVDVSGDAVDVRFGPGVIRRRFRPADIRHVDVVRNHWYYGWGIRYTPHGWLFAVAGLDAVEIGLASGRTFRIGTDEPRALAAAIRTAAGLPAPR